MQTGRIVPKETAFSRQKIGRRYLIHFRIGAAQPALGRIKQAATGVERVLKTLAVGTGNLKLAYTSHDGSCFGFLIKTTKRATAIAAQLQCPQSPEKWDPLNPSSTRSLPPPLMGEDSFLIVEVGEDFCGLGMSKAWTWLQRH